MPDNRSVIRVSTGVIIVAALLRLWPANCPLQANAAPQIQFTDKKWGEATNVTITRQNNGDLITATSADGMHRVIETVPVPAAGIYRVSVETVFAGASAFMLEVGGPDQPKYAIITGNAKSGQIAAKKGDIIAAGVEPVPGAPRRYRWWLDMDFIPGQASYNVAIARADDNRQFRGSEACKIVLNSTSFAAVPR